MYVGRRVKISGSFRRVTFATSASVSMRWFRRITINFKAFEIYSYAAIIYIVVITALTFLSKYVERRLAYDKR